MGQTTARRRKRMVMVASKAHLVVESEAAPAAADLLDGVAEVAPVKEREDEADELFGQALEGGPVVVLLVAMQLVEWVEAGGGGAGGAGGDLHGLRSFVAADAVVTAIVGELLLLVHAAGADEERGGGWRLLAVEVAGHEAVILLLFIFSSRMEVLVLFRKRPTHHHHHAVLAAAMVAVVVVDCHGGGGGGGGVFLTGLLLEGSNNETGSVFEYRGSHSLFGLRSLGGGE